MDKDTAAKDGSNNNTLTWPRKEKDKASRRARMPSTYATNVDKKDIMQRIAEWQCATSQTLRHISLILQRNGTQTQDRHMPQTGGKRITQEQHNRQQQHMCMECNNSM